MFMSVLFILIPLSLLLSSLAFFAFVKSAQSGQLDVEEKDINDLLDLKGTNT